MKNLILITCLILTMASCSQDRGMDIANLNVVKAGITGKWYRLWGKDTIFEKFIFADSSYEGYCYSNEYAGGHSFTLRRKENSTGIIWHIVNGNPDYIINKLTARKMEIEYNDDGPKSLEYFR